MGLLLLNVGTPDDPGVPAVRAFLRQFLSDPRVIDISPLARGLLLNLVILPRRPRRTAAAYRQIWTAEGSPLLVHGRALAAEVQRRLGDEVAVALAMRYGRPALAAELERLLARGVERIVAFPLFPHDSAAAGGTCVAELMRLLAARWQPPPLQVIPAYFDHPAYVGAVAEIARRAIEEARPERLVFSYHGLPERQIRRADRGERCLQPGGTCCAPLTPQNRHCYRAQCLETSRLLSQRLGGAIEAHSCFQSRVGRQPWIGPDTDETLTELLRAGVRRVLVITPGFAADCLETLEELGIRAAARWRAGGGERLALAPCLNADDSWADAVVTIAREHCGWLPQSRAPWGTEAASR